MKLKNRSTTKTIVRNVELEEVQDFKYLGSYISTDSNIEKEISTRIGLAAQAFNRLQSIWKSTALQTKTKLKIYRSNVRSVLLYASETWRTNKRLESRLRGFEGRCLRRILRIRWEQRVTNKEISRRTSINNIVEDVKQRRWRWFGHVLRMNKNRHPRAALRWTPPGKRKRGRPLGTWRRTIDEEMKAAGKTWNGVSWLARQDRDGWKKCVGALCSTWSEEDWWWWWVVKTICKSSPKISAVYQDHRIGQTESTCWFTFGRNTLATTLTIAIMTLTSGR